MFNTVKNSREPSVFRASTGYSKLLNNKKYMFNTVKNIRATLFFRASAGCSKLLSNEKYMFNTVKISGQLCFSGQALVAQKF